MMGYFPNGTSGDVYQEEYCSRCVNWRDSGDGRGFGCPIIDLHLLWNYDAVGVGANKTKHEALAHFIPIDGINNARCLMFQEVKPTTTIQYEYCSRCDNPTIDAIEKIEGVLCAACASKLEKALLAR